MLELHAITVRFGNATAVDDVDLTVANGVTTALLGPSGSGKTTLLRVIAGLQQPDAGRVLWRGRDVTAVPPHHRKFGLMFQDFALFPHKSVGANVAFGLEMKQLPAGEVTRAVAAALDLVGLGDFADRNVASLSGGEAQRVALARALAPGPDLLMFDEPLGALDRRLRERLMVELREMLDGLDITAIYVTHDRDEALAVADHLAVLDAGAVVQAGTAEEVWNAPAGPFVARFLGLGTVFEADVSGGVAATPFGPLPLTGAHDGRHAILLRDGTAAIDAGGALRGTVRASRFAGGGYDVTIAGSGDTTIRVVSQHRHDPGQELHFAVAPDAIRVLD